MQEIVALLSVLVPLVGIFAYFQWQVQKRTFKLDLMTKVHERYSKLYKSLANLEGYVLSYHDLPSETKEAVSAYINLCAEQFHWHHSEKMIDAKVWHVWEAAMKQKFELPAFGQAWRDIRRKDEYYQGFKEFVDRHVVTK